MRIPPHSLDHFPTETVSLEKESDGGGDTLMSCVNVVKRHVEINLIGCQNIDLDKFLEMVREHSHNIYRFNMLAYTLLAASHRSLASYSSLTSLIS